MSDQSISELLSDPSLNPFYYDIDHDFNLPPLDSFEPTDLKYLTTETFSSFLYIIINGSRNVNLKTISNNIRDDFFEIDFESLDFRISTTLFSAIHNNLTNISILPINLLFPYPTITGHSNVIIINPMTQTIEFFEPHGIEFSNSIENILDTTSIIMKLFFQVFPEFIQFNFVNSSKNCVIGPQGLQGIVDRSAGHCLAWSLLFIQLRLSYITKTSDFVVSSLSKINPLILDIYIKQYITFLNSISVHRKNNTSSYKRSFRYLLSNDEIDIETEYLKNLISEYWTTLQSKIDLIDNDTSSEDCYICALVGIKSDHKYSFCSFNQFMLELNAKISKLFKSIHGYRNTPNFDENFHHESIAYFYKDIHTPLEEPY
jgi:hypothetical protein